MITSYKELRYYLHNDKINSEFDSKLYRLFFPNPIWRFIITLRVLEYLVNTSNKPFIGWIKRFLSLFFRIRFRRISLRLGFSIPINCLGPGVSLPHYGTIIINPNVRIGANCRIHTCVNIGASGGSSNTPIIGDNVYIGPGAILFGHIQIADNVTIGANATVNKSFLTPNCTIAGTPASIVKTNTVSWYDSKLKMKKSLEV